MFFGLSLTGGEDEDEEAQEERREQGKALLATRTDPHGCVALRGMGVQKPGHSLSSRCQKLVTATSFHDRSPWREEHTHIDHDPNRAKSQDPGVNFVNFF